MQMQRGIIAFDRVRNTCTLICMRIRIIICRESMSILKIFYCGLITEGCLSLHIIHIGEKLSD